MSRNPYGTDELDRVDPDLDQVAEELERYAADERREPPLDLSGRIHAAIDAEPGPVLGWRRSLPAALRAWRAPARGLALAAMLVVAVVGALAVGELIEDARRRNVGTSPSPSVVITPSPSPSPSPTPSASPSPSSTPTESPRSAEPSPSESEGAETPEPTESDNSGPGGGGGDNSGPGGGGGDNSGPGGGG